MKNGGYKTLPNCLPDIYLRVVSDVQYKVLECISRKTLGWWKRWDGIPLSQFEGMMGNSRPAIVQLHRHPLIMTSEIGEIMEREYEHIKSLRIERRPYPQDEETGLWRCSCGWNGKGTGYNGALVEGDRCPDCNLYL